MSEVPSRDHRKARTQAIVAVVVLVASGLETLALASGMPTLQDLLLGLIAIAMVAAAIGG